MIRVILRGLASDTGDGALIGDFLPEHIDALVDHLNKTPIYSTATDEYLTVANDVQGGPLQWVYTDDRPPRLLLEILVEEVES